MTPADSYHEALSSHRHYDTLANAALSLVGAGIAGAPALYASASAIKGSEIILALSSVVIIFAVQSYRRFDRYAGIALNVAAAIERNDQRFISPPTGFATVFANIGGYSDLDATGKSWSYRRIRLVGYSASVIFVLSAALIFAGRF